MKIDELNYELPNELIAQSPAQQRANSRLLMLDRKTGSYEDRIFFDIIDYLWPGDCLVINNTKVLPARFFGHRATGARFEGLFLEFTASGLWHVMLTNSRKIKIGDDLILIDTNKNDCVHAIPRQRLEDGSWLIEVESDHSPEAVLEMIGYAPLPPYIKRPDGGSDPQNDRSRYQTVFAEKNGAVAAPTAGLHFTRELMDQASAKGVEFARVTLHVGAGTFKPVTVENVEDHDIHSERYEITQENADAIRRCKSAGGRIIAVGTTSVRTLETLARESGLVESSGSTRLFITPGFEFKVVDAIITNFHLPKSTLLALVGAFAGMDNMMNAYRHAVEEKYHFFSYGDAMFIR